MKKNQIKNGFTLIEMMIIIAIIGILAVIAFPKYETYKTRAQITETLLFAASIKIDVVTSYFGQGKMLPIGYDGSRNQYGRYVKSAQVDSSGAIIITINDEANMAIRGKTLTLVPIANPSESSKNSIEWECDFSSEDSIPQNYLPSPCR